MQPGAAPASLLYHTGRALFAALSGDESLLHQELRLVLSHDVDGRHRRWAREELSFAPFRNLDWFQRLLAGEGAAEPPALS